MILVGLILFVFRSSVLPVLKELKQTAPWCILVICLSSMLYGFFEGCVTTTMARQYLPDFQLREGVASAFYVSFYRTATLGSGDWVAGILYMHEKGMSAGEATGMVMLQYIFHKCGIALLSIVLFILHFPYMNHYFHDYLGLLAGACVLTASIAIALFLICCSKKLHAGLLTLARKLDKKGKHTSALSKLEEESRLMEQAAQIFLKKPKLICNITLKILIKLVFWYGIPFLVCITSGKLDLVSSLAVTSMAVMVAAVIPAPAGIGSTEVVLTLFYSAILGTAKAGSIALLYRFATFVFPFFVGGVIVLLKKWHLKSERKKLDRGVTQ
ncbi:MAG: YbhN family protein [Lachnospiraceae bacterium]